MVGRNEKCPCGSGKKFKKCCLNKKKVDQNKFVLTKEVFERDFLPYYDVDKNSLKTFIEFELVLPFYIPLEEGKTLTIGYDKVYVSFRFDKLVTNESYIYSLENPDPILDVYRTKLIMMAAIPLSYEDFLKDSEKNLNYYFDLLLTEFNKIVISYMTATKDDECHYLTKEMLPPAIVVNTTNLDTWKSSKILLMLHTKINNNKNLLNEKDIQELVRTQFLVTFEINPFVTGERYVLFARRYLKQGFYHEAVLYAQISVEVFIRQLYKELLKEADRKTEKEIIEIMENTPFMSIIKKQLQHYLGGNWNIKNESTIIGKWYEKTYELRNKATHTGKIPTYLEASEALYYAEEFRNFILKRIKANKKKYPNLNRYFN